MWLVSLQRPAINGQTYLATWLIPLLKGLACLVLSQAVISCSGSGTSSSTDGSKPIASSCNPPILAASLTTHNINTVRNQHTAILLPDGHVLLTGGYGSSGPLASAERYNPTQESWTPTGSLGTARGDHTATLLSNGKVLVTGGSGPTGVLASAELYEPTTGSWTQTNPPGTPRTQHTATLLSDGRVLVTGGYGPTGLLTSAELFEPTTGSWTQTNPHGMPRARHTATLLSDGKVLLTGGYGPSGPLASAEHYDPAQGLWTPTGSLSTARGDHTATLLSDRKVLVTGGYGPTGVVTATEVIDFAGEVQAILEWNPHPDHTVIGFRVYRGTTPGTYAETFDVGLSTLHRFSNLARNTIHFFTVTAYNSAGESCGSNVVSKKIS